MVMERIYKAKQDFNGKSNTSTILAYGKAQSISYPAAEYVNSYTTTGTNAGEWYLPASGELYTAYSNKDFLNYALSLVGKKDIPTDFHWSSSENSIYGAWGLRFWDGDVYHTNKGFGNGYSIYVRPVLAF